MLLIVSAILALTSACAPDDTAAPALPLGRYFEKLDAAPAAVNVSAGIEAVWVAGRQVFGDGRATGERPGAVIRRATR